MRMRIALFLLASPIAQAAMAAGVIDLDTPGALEALRAQRPAHYAKVEAILALAQARPAPTTPSLMEARFGASDVELLQWRVSDPPRLRVSFTLDDTRYTGEVVPSLRPARALPAR